jgi:hypothetical protein
MNPFLVMDLEADGLNEPWKPEEYANKIHCICAIDQDDNEFIMVEKEHAKYIKRLYPQAVIAPLKYIKKLITQYKALVCHNIINYDLPVLSRLIGFEYDLSPSHIGGHELEIIDSLIDSRWLWPDRPLPAGCPASIDNPVTGKSDKVGPHGLAAWSYRTGGTKPVVHDWRNQPIEVYVERCMEDARNNKLVFAALIKEMADWYKVPGKVSNWKAVRDKARMPIWIEHLFSHIMHQQAMTGYPFNSDKAEALYERLMSDMAVLEAKIEPSLPELPIPKSRLKKDWKTPANLFKGDATPTVNFEKWLIKHNAKLIQPAGDSGKFTVEAYGKVYDLPLPEYIRTTEPLRLANSAGIKKYLMDYHSWRPLFWNYKKDQWNKPIRDEITKELIPTTPKMKDAATGMICPNLLELDAPLAKDIILYNTLKHRRNMLKSISNEETGFLNHPRLAYDGRLPGEGNTIGAATCRVTHRVIANIPKADEKVVYGAEMRDLFYAPDGWYVVGWDAQAIEARLDGAEAFEFDNGEYANVLLNEDIHQLRADKFKVTRNKAKSIGYMLLYGGGVGKVATMLDCNKAQAEVFLEQWWSEAWASRMAIDKHIEVWEKLGGSKIVGVDGRPLGIRKKHSVFNTRLQNAGTTVMKLSGCLLYDKTLEYRKAGTGCKVIDYHDEAGWLVRKDLVKWKVFGTAEEAKEHQADGANGKTGSKAIEKNGKFYVAFCDIGRLGVECITEAGKMLDIKVTLTGAYQVGKSWKDTH